MDISWEKDAQEKFKQMIEKVPVFLRNMAQENVLKKLESIVSQNNHVEATEKDMVDAFFAATPFGFHGPMKCDMEDLGIDYQKYGYKR